MSLRHNIIAIACVLLAGCGLHPMYGDNAIQSSNTPLQGNIIIDPILGRNGQILKAALEDRFNPEGIKFETPDYRLQIILTETSVPAVVRNDGTIQRYEVRINSSFKLLRNGDAKVISTAKAKGDSKDSKTTDGPKPIFTGDLRRISSYNAANDANFATYEAEQNTIERMLKEMAEDYVLRMSGYFASQPNL